MIGLICGCMIGSIAASIAWLTYLGGLFGGKLVKTSDEDGTYLSAVLENQECLNNKFIIFCVVEPNDNA